MIKSLHNLTVATAGILISLGTMELLAHEEGDFILRVGAAHVSPNDDSSNVLGTDDGVTVGAAHRNDVCGVQAATGLGVDLEQSHELRRNIVFSVDVNRFLPR